MPVDPAVVLLVEDNEDHAELVMRQFADQQPDSQLVHLSDGRAALDYLLRSGEYASQPAAPLPRMILLDLRLPRVDGLEVLRIIKATEKLRRIPVIILSTSSAVRDIAQAYDEHVNSYVVKPIDFEQFHRMIAVMSAYWLTWNA